MGRNVSVLMPPLFAQQHDRYVKAYLNTGHAKILNRVRQGAIAPPEVSGRRYA